jgi:ferric-dicitrate binding protein FerR (iron transport regulator)
MQREARDLIAAAEANPGKETATAIYRFIDRSLEHKSCFRWELQQQSLLQQPFRINHATQERRWVGAVLAGLVAAAVVLFVLYAPSREAEQSRILRTYAYAQTYELEDGSPVLLYPNSSMRLAPGSRRIDLLSGGLAAKPKHDASHPFEVVAGNTRAVSLGTRFTVLRRPDNTEVALTEGKLRVLASNGRSVELAPGELTRVNAEGAITDPAPVLTASARTSVESRIGTITQIAAAFNAQNSLTQIEVIGDPGKRYEFRLQLDNPAEWLQELARNPFIRIERNADLITIVKITFID